jgi:hypothetical protein
MPRKRWEILWEGMGKYWKIWDNMGNHMSGMLQTDMIDHTNIIQPEIMVIKSFRGSDNKG